MTSLFCCPICGAALHRDEKTYHCPAGHSFDRAAEGYVHLLPPNRMHAKIPGDNKQMVAARRAFLDAGYYQLFSSALNSLAAQLIAPIGHPVRILDCGCGEGYYTGRLASHLACCGAHAALAGFDISKFAVKAAARRYEGIEFAVASCYHIPAAAQEFDLAVNVFAPIAPQELLRILRPNGALLYAVPSKRHLYGLKELLYDCPYENEEKDVAYPGFCLEERVPVRGKLLLTDRAMIDSLFSMTPYYWKTSVQGSARLHDAERLETEIGFDFLIYRRNMV